jgi:sugar phosphate isomerase/epimerase
MAAERAAPRLAGIGDEAGGELAVQLGALARLGWEAIELRTIAARALDELGAAELRAVAARLSEHGMTVCCLCSNVGGWGRSVATPLRLDLDELDRLECAASVLGCRCVRVMSWQNAGLSERTWREAALARMGALADRAKRLGLVLLHENCAGWGGSGAAAARELAGALEGESFGLLLDIGNCIAYGQDPVELTAALAGRVRHVHVKDAVREPRGVRFVAPGTGEARVGECLRILAAHRYAGVLSLEPHLHAAPHRGASASGARALADFLACGEALEALVCHVWDPAGCAQHAHARPNNQLTTERSH